METRLINLEHRLMASVLQILTGIIREGMCKLLDERNKEQG